VIFKKLAFLLKDFRFCQLDIVVAAQHNDRGLDGDDGVQDLRQAEPGPEKLWNRHFRGVRKSGM
jgi:hypothetical protein